MVKTSQLIWYAGIVGIVASGALNAVMLVETLHMVTVQVPTRTLGPYQTIGSNDVTTKQLPMKALDSDTLTGSLIGKVTALTIPKGSQIQSFEIAQQNSMAQVIQNLYMAHPNYAFAQIQVQNTGLSQTIQPGQHVNFLANNMAYSNVWVLSVTNPNGQTNSIGSQLNQAVTNFVSVTPTSSGSTGDLSILIGAPWATVQALMSSGNAQVVMGNAGNTTAQYTLGSPPVSQTVPAAGIPHVVQTIPSSGVSHVNTQHTTAAVHSTNPLPQQGNVKLVKNHVK